MSYEGDDSDSNSEVIRMMMMMMMMMMMRRSMMMRMRMRRVRVRMMMMMVIVMTKSRIAQSHVLGAMPTKATACRFYWMKPQLQTQTSFPVHVFIVGHTSAAIPAAARVPLLALRPVVLATFQAFDTAWKDAMLKTGLSQTLTLRTGNQYLKISSLFHLTLLYRLSN